MDIDELKDRYQRAIHAMQSGVAYSRDKTNQEPKHLRVGINVALRDVGALSYLLVKKGVFTELELWEALADGAEAEVKEYERKLSAAYGATVTLA